jgi:hypothetical protein
MTIPVFEIELSPVLVGAVHESSHGDMTTIDRVTSMKEEELRSVNVARSGSVGSVIFQKSSEAKHPGSVCYIYIYIYMKTCIFVHQYR